MGLCSPCKSVSRSGNKCSRFCLFRPWAIPLLSLFASIFLCTIGAADSTINYSVKAPLASSSLLLDGVFVGGRIVVVGERGHILISEDHGRSWSQATVPTQVTLTGVFFHDKDTGWAVGHDAVILRTKDGGKSWERIYYAPEKECPLLDVLFLDAKNGIAVGAYGLFLVTADGGDVWTQQQMSEDDFHLNHIAKSVTGELFIAAEGGRSYRSDDNGRTWIELPSPYKGSFFGILPLNQRSLLLFGLRGHLYRSADSGQTWDRIETSTKAMLTTGAILPDGTTLVAGLGGTVLVSRDGGNSFMLLEQPDRRGISKLIQAGDGAIVAVGENGARTLSISP